MFRKPLPRPKHALRRQRTCRARTAVIVATAAAAQVIAAVGLGGASLTYAATAGFISNLVTDPNAVYSEPQVSKPTYLTNMTDPTFHTNVARIAGDANSSFTFSGGGSGTWGSDARQHYNDDQAWNADGSLLMLQNSGTPEQVILDGNTYQPKYGKCSNYSNYDDRWLPQLSHKYERMNVRGSTLEWFDVVNCVQTRSWSLPFTAQNDLSQNPSADGRYTALYDGKRIFVVDMDPQAPFAAYPNKRIGPAFDLSACGLSDCSVDFAEISPSGHHIIVAYNGDHNRLLDVDPSTLAITPHAYPSTVANCSSVAGHDPTQGYMFDLGHPGAGFNPFDNNEEVMVGQRRSWCPSTVDGTSLGPVVMVRLSDNKVTSLITPGNTASAYHISMVNSGRPGWAYVSFWPSSGTRFSDEIIAVKLDGSGSVQRLTHTHTDTTNCYRCEAHPVPSRDGMRVLFASAWNMYCGSGCGSSSNPQAYIVDARAPESSQDSAPVAALTVTPASAAAPVTVTGDASGSVDSDATPIGSYRFDWGDGSSSTSTTTPTASHTYSAAGTYSVTVTVTDTAGLSGTATASVTVNSSDAAPVARLVVTPTSGTAPVTVSADASTSTDTDATPIASYQFTWGDGSADTVGSSPTASHAFVGPGSYSVSVRVTDSAGLAATAGTTVTATSPPPTTNNLVGNPGFENNLTGWNNGGRSGTALSVVTGGHSGSYAALLKNTSGKTINELTLNDSPNWVSSTQPGTYRATLWVRSDQAGARLVLQLREYQGGTLVGSQRTSVTLSTSWQPVTVSYTVVAPGSSTIDFGAYIKNAGAATSFYADDAEIVIS